MNISSCINSLKTEITKKLKLSNPPFVLWKNEKFAIHIQEDHDKKLLSSTIEKFGIFWEHKIYNQVWYSIKNDYVAGLTEQYIKSNEYWKPTQKNRKILINITSENYNQYPSFSWLRSASMGNIVKNYHNFCNDDVYFELVINDYISNKEYKQSIWKGYTENKENKETIKNDFLSYLKQKYGDELKKYNFETFENINLGGYDQFLFDNISQITEIINIDFDSVTFYHDLEENNLIENYIDELLYQNKILTKNNVFILKNEPYNIIIKNQGYYTEYPFQKIYENITKSRKFEKVIQLKQHKEHLKLKQTERSIYQLLTPTIDLYLEEDKETMLTESPDSFIWTNIGIEKEITIEDIDEYTKLEESLQNIKNLYNKNIQICASLNEVWNSWDTQEDSNLIENLITPQQNYFLLQILNWNDILKDYEKTYNPTIIQEWLTKLNDTYREIYNNNKFVDIDDKKITGHWIALATLYLFAVYNSLQILGIKI